MAARKILDLDEVLADDIAADREAVQYRPIKFLGREWRVTTQPSAFASIGAAGGDSESIAALITGVIHPDEQVDFKRALLKENLSAETLVKYLNAVTEEAADGRPTKRSSGNSRTSSRTRDA